MFKDTKEVFRSRSLWELSKGLNIFYCASVIIAYWNRPGPEPDFFLSKITGPRWLGLPIVRTDFDSPFEFEPAKFYWFPLQFTEHLIYNSMPGSVTYIRRSWKNFLYSSLPSLVHHKSINKPQILLNSTFWHVHVKQSSDETVNRPTVVKLDDVKQLTLNIF